MPTLSTLGVFAGVALVLLLTPGPAVLFIVARSLAQGRRAGFVSILGLTAGGLVHVLAAAAGVSAILASSAAAFRAVQLLGAAYLLFLGARRWWIDGRRRRDGGEGGAPAFDGPSRLFRQGFLVNLTNPKAALFFLAFLPQFVDPSRGSVLLQTFVLGFVFLGLGLVTDGAYVLLAGGAGAWLRRSPLLAWQGRIESGVYLGLGVAAAAAGCRR